ncbi:MAG: Inositol-pentakisphosphate 2-kinase [Chrysothrix sp. TS-e1954]|nr:MAG: Inositol-pentakisphosphate 2-kinase [Chrysothrix sp. TS-e1954]
MSVGHIPHWQKLDYYAEGAANILYRVVPRDPSVRTATEEFLDGVPASDNGDFAQAPYYPLPPGRALVRTPSDLDVVTSPTEADLDGFPATTDNLTPPPTIIDIPATNNFAASISSRNAPPAPGSISLPDSTRLLRLRKETEYPSLPTLDALQLHNRSICPLFPSRILLDYHPVSIRPQMIMQLNTQLHELEQAGKRHNNRNGFYLDETDRWGLLVDDMTLPSKDGTSIILLEIKPKWLIQSREAPSDANRCRTCALRAKKGQTDIQTLRWCPLDLASGDRDSITRAVQAFTGADWAARCVREKGVSQAWLADARRRIVDYFLGSDLIRCLKAQQVDYPQFNVCLPGLHVGDNEGGSEQDISPCMTLRDCTLYLRIPLDTNKTIEGKLGDLDVKLTSDEKMEYWQMIESQLSQQGYYHGREQNRDYGTEEICRLMRTRRANGATGSRPDWPKH